MDSFSRFGARYAPWVAFVGTLLAVIGGYYSVLLYKNLRTDIEELLPTQARSGHDLKELTQRLESFDYIAVLVFSKDAKAGRRYVDDLATRLQAIPTSLAASVEYRIGPEMSFFRKRLGLYLEMPDLVKVKDYVRDRIRFEKEMYNPLNIFPVTDRFKRPELDLDALRRKHQGAGNYEKYPDGYYATPDGTKRVVLVYLAGKHSDIHKAKELKQAVSAIVDGLPTRPYAPDLEVKYTGGVESFLEEHAALIADLTLSTIVVTVLVTLAMLLFYRNLLATIALVSSLFIGTLWTFGVAYFAVGYLNANSAFLGSIVIGNGINFGIILLARYLEERRRGVPGTDAVILGTRATFAATVTAALAAGLSYGSLVLTRFRGFRQFGVIGLIGMILCWISAYTVLPAFLTLLERYWNKRKKTHALENSTAPDAMGTGQVSREFARLVETHWKLVAIASVLLTVWAIGMFPRFGPGIIQTDLSKLRNKESLERGAGYLDRYLVEIFQRYLTPTVIFAKTPGEAEKIAALLKSRRDGEGEKTEIGSIQTLQDFVPPHQNEKIKVLREIRATLTPKVVDSLNAQDRAWMKDCLSADAFETFTAADVPKLVTQKFTETDGTQGKMVVVNPPLRPNDDIAWNGARLIGFVRELREVADSVRPGTPVSGQLPISADLVESISEDGPRATLFALLSVVALIIILFRDPETIGLALLALFQGVLWLAGLILGFRLKINFLNFIALPITFGIGVDYGVNVFQRYREEKQRDPSSRRILTVIRQTGGAVMLASLTTIIGYSSLLIAGNQAFVSFGRLAVLGEITCIAAAVLALPAYLLFRDRREERAPRPIIDEPEREGNSTTAEMQSPAH